MSYVLSIDCGTQSIRAIVFNEKGEMLLCSKKSFEAYYSLKPGWAEQDTDVFWQSLCQVTNDIVAMDLDIMDEVTSIVLTTQRDTCVLMDKDGNALRPAIIWADQRELINKRKFAPTSDLAFAMVGMKEIAHNLSDQFPGHWIQDYEKDIWDKTYKYVLLSGFLNYKLTGEFLDSVGNQIGHIPFNYKKFEWYKKGALKKDLFKIEDDKLIEIRDIGEVLGYLTSDAAIATGLKKGIKIIAGGSDKGCETIGVGCSNEKTASISFGTQATIQVTSDRYYEVEPFMPPFPAVIPNRYNPEIQVYRGYWMISWFKKEFAEKEAKIAIEKGISPEDILNKELSTIPPGCDGLILTPYWGAGNKNPEAKGAIIGFSDVHTRVHIYRAIIEGIGFAIYEGMKAIEKKSKTKVERIMLSGGGSSSDQICQITADLFNLPVSRVQTNETSALGAAIIGYVANSTYSTYEEAIENMVHVNDEFLPSKENTQIYEKIYNEIYKNTYKQLKPLYKSMQKILK